MAQKQKRLTKIQRIAKVKRALKKFVPWNGRKPLNVVRAVMVDNMVDRATVLYLGGGQWTWTGRGDLGGVIEGYNRYTTNVAYALASLRLLTREDADAFEEWFHRQDKKHQQESEFHRACDIVNEHGYKLVKKIARKAA